MTEPTVAVLKEIREQINRLGVLVERLTSAHSTARLVAQLDSLDKMTACNHSTLARAMVDLGENQRQRWNACEANIRRIDSILRARLPKAKRGAAKKKTAKKSSRKR